MKKNYILSAICCALSVSVAHAAGTYYTGGTYKSPQYRYGTQSQYSQNTNTRTAANNYYQPVSSSYSQQYSASGVKKNKNSNVNSQTKNGFYLNGGISRESGMWDFKMKTVGSNLHYDNINWNVFDLNAGYAFDNFKIDAGFKYGSQSGESTMIDDDISNGGYYIGEYVNGASETVYVLGRAISAGKSGGGSLSGFNLGVGLTNKLALGKVAITPSIGYRQLAYSLETSKNYGISIETGECVISTNGQGEVQCIPYIVVDGGAVDTGNTFYYEQTGASHKYDVSWSGPYAALDLDYKIDENNAVNGRIELGLPSYTATGNQPYRIDWMHPKSVEDTAGMGSAYHLGLLGNYKTAISDSVALTIGFSYDYYTVSGANAQTNLNGDYYMMIYNNTLTGGTIDGIDWGTGYADEAAMLSANSTAAGIAALYENCPNWVCKAENEVDSFYKSMGIRVGISSRF